MDVQFVASVAVIAPDPPTSRKLFVDTLGLPLRRTSGEYWSSEEIGGSRHFGVWPLSHAAEACFGTTEWPDDVPIPQMSIEFEVATVDAVAPAAAELRAAGYSLLHAARTEPWGQTVTRILSPEGAIVGISYAPWMHGEPAEPASD
jgi:catechol 2,3-dioxygenase-like lactoylglutathione lyase family enzyme